jgi:pyridoxamine 5'-phosphate oxidase
MERLNEYLFASRKDYEKNQLSENQVDRNPFRQFEIWFEEIRNSTTEEPYAFTLATCTREGKPSARILLLRKMTEHEGFIFFTNYLSRKGNEIEENPYGAMLFYWHELERQVRIEGKIQKLDAKYSDEYFSSRPRLSQISACVSPQSKKIPHREFLENEVKKYELIQELKRPDFWGGYQLIPEYFEFWQGRKSRLHDRIIYEWIDNQWRISRLAP